MPPFVDFPEELKALVYGGQYMISGGLEYNAVEIDPIDPEEVRVCVRNILSSTGPRVRHVVISGVFSPYDKPCGRQEKEVEEIVKETCPKISCTLSHQLGMLGLIERENAAILNEALKNLAKVTVSAIKDALTELTIHCPFYLTQNDGTMISAEEAMEFPVQTFSSGPTNSMRGAAYLSGLQNAIVVDIGGTTTDVGVLRNGFPREASANCMIGDVRTNFSMPDVQSIALGGGTIIQWDEAECSAVVGPDSVEYRIKEEALCFGGDRCTATDVAIAAGVAPQDISTAPQQALSALSLRMVYAAMREIKRKIEVTIDSMKTEKEDVPVILVGGGCIMVDSLVPLRGVSRVILPPDHWDVANAVGAALGTVGGACEFITDLSPIKEELKESEGGGGGGRRRRRRGGGRGGDEGLELDHRAREAALEQGRESAREIVINKGAIPASVYIHSEDIFDVQYMVDRVRVKVKAIGALTTQDSTLALPPPPVESHREPERATFQENQDNPFWPNSSAKDRAEDAAADLPPPQVDDARAVWTLSEHDVECLAIGAGILGCGGGGDPNSSRIMAVRMLQENREIKILNPYKVDEREMGLVCGVGFMGAPIIQLEKLVGGEETALAFTRLRQTIASGVCTEQNGGGKVGTEQVRVMEKQCVYKPELHLMYSGNYSNLISLRRQVDGQAFTRVYGEDTFTTYLANNEDLSKQSLENLPLERRVTALICLEAGGLNSIEPLLVGAKTRLPVLDMDGMGRAFPELQMYIPFIHGASHCPSALADNKGEAVVCTSVDSSQQLEKFFRVEAVRMGMCAGVATGVMPFRSTLSQMVLFTMSRAWQLGRAVQRATRTHSPIMTAIAQQQNGLVLITGKVVSVSRKIGGGFTRIVSVVEGLEEFSGFQVRVQAKNENYIAEKIMDSKGETRPQVLACTPDLISIVDSNTGIPVTTEQMRYGLRVGVVVLPANPILKTPQALKVVGPTAFDFAMDYTEPRPLK